MTKVDVSMSGLGVLDPDIYERGDPWTAGLPLDLFTRLRVETPCYWQSLKDNPVFRPGAWVVSRYADIRSILKDTDRFLNCEGTSVRELDPTVSHRGGKPSMVSLDGERHKVNRGVTNRFFTPRAISAFTALYRTLAAEIVDKAVAKGEVDFVTGIASLLPLHVISELLGIPDGDRTRVLAWTNMISVPLDPGTLPSPEEFGEALEGLWSYGRKIADLRRNNPDSGIMAAIAQGRADGRIGDDEVAGYMFNLATAGNETTRNAIAFGLHALLLRPDQMAHLRSSAAMPDTAIEEMLRWSSPTLHTVRTPTGDVEILGRKIREGDAVALLLSSANFDPAVFRNPEQFDTRRTPNEHLAFGTGIHTCLGNHVARLEIRVLFEELLRKTRSIELAGPVELVRDNFIHGIRKMPIKLLRAE
jgi:cholest-4-en-3-one 26-monooxygenase